MFGGSAFMGGGFQTATRSRGGGYQFTNAEAAALVARFTTPPTDARKALIDALVGTLKAGGVWEKLDTLYILAAADSQAARLNWIVDLYNLTPINSPVFTPDRGYQGDSSTSYLASGFNPTTAPSPKFVRDSAHLSFWSLSDINDATDFDIGGTSAFLNARSTSANTSRGRLNSASNINFGAIANSLGHFLISRTTAALQTVFKGGASIGTNTDASTAVTSTNFTLLASQDTGNQSGRQLAQGSWGAGLSGAEAAAFEAALDTYLTAVGAN